MKYLVMECHPGCAVVLSDDGRFLKVANMGYEVGQTVTNVVEMCLPQQPVKMGNRRWISVLAAVAACLALIVTSVFFTGQMPYAFVYITINPEVRVDVNRNDVVVDVKGMNADGAELLRDYDHRKKDLDTVMDELVDLAIDMGYLHEGGKVTLTLDAQDEEWVVTHSEELGIHLTEHLTDKISVVIDVERKAAEETTQPSGIVVPVGPDGYQDSDYGEIMETTAPPAQTTTVPPATEDSGYDDGQTDYDDVSGDDGDTSYGEPSDGDEDPPGETQSDDDGDTHYEEPSENDDTDYDDRSDEEDTDYDD